MPSLRLSLRRVLAAHLLAVTLAPAQTLPATPAASTPAAAGVDSVTLSPFEVRADSDTGYAASTAMSGTRTNEKLENLPNSISVMTQEFIQDLAFNSYFDAVDFAMNAENIANDLGTVGAAVGNRGGNQVNIRGLASVRQLRDGFPWYLATDSYNTERIEFSRGPGGLAYGDVDAGGSINIGSKRASFQRRGSAQVRYDNFGTQRYSIDLNQPLVPGKLGARFNAIKSEVEMFKQRQGRDLEGYAAAFRWEPFKHRRTQIEVMGEKGHTVYHLGHLGPTDSRIAYVPGTGTTALDADPNRAGVQVNGVGMQQLRAPNAVAHAIVDVGGVINNWQSTATNTFRITTTNTAAAATAAADPQNPLRYPLRRVPESIIPLSQDWAGPDNKMSSKYYAYTVELKHAFSDRLSALVAHNGQFDETIRKQTYSSLTSVGAVPGRSVHVDVNPVLPNPNGPGTVPNPNYEQMYIVHSPLLQPRRPQHHRLARAGRLRCDPAVGHHAARGVRRELPPREELPGQLRLFAHARRNREAGFHGERRVFQQQPRSPDPLSARRQLRREAGLECAAGHHAALPPQRRQRRQPPAGPEPHVRLRQYSRRLLQRPRTDEHRPQS